MAITMEDEGAETVYLRTRTCVLQKHRVRMGMG